MNEGLKFDQDKVPVHLLPPDAIWEISKVLGFGARKYTEWNWYGGIRYSRLFAALLRHMWQWWRRKNNDSESGFNHLAHAGCCLLFLLQQVLEERSNQDDRPEWNTCGAWGGLTNDGTYEIKEEE